MAKRVNFHLLVTVVLWAGNFAAIKALHQQLSTEAVALLRTIPTAIFFVIVAKWQGESLRFTSPEHAWRSILQGFLSMGIYMILFLAGLHRTNENAGAIIMATSPLMTGLLSVVFKQDKFRWDVLIGAAIALGGIGVIFGHGSEKPGELLGNFLVFAGALVWALSVIVIRPLLRDHSPAKLTAQAMIGGCLVMIPFGWSATMQVEWASILPLTWAALLYTSILSGGVAFITYYQGISEIGAARATLYQYLIPPTAILIGHFLLGTPILTTQIVGLVIVLAGVMLGNRVQATSKLAT
ncbi:MAG: EamA family transporter [Chthonomonas sp.]|nr:EamA family transporter [Chthonomonas sp.]